MPIIIVNLFFCKIFYKRQELLTLGEHLGSLPVCSGVRGAQLLIPVLCCGFCFVFCLISSCVLCARCCQCLWIVLKFFIVPLVSEFMRQIMRSSHIIQLGLWMIFDGGSISRGQKYIWQALLHAIWEIWNQHITIRGSVLCLATDTISVITQEPIVRRINRCRTN